MIILGVDPGTATTGYGVIARRADRKMQLIEYGTIKTSSRKPLARRLVDIHIGMAQLLEKHKPDAVAVEQLFFSRNTSTAFSVGQARGVLLLAAAQADLTTDEYTPLQVKQSVTGQGRASKKQVAYMVKLLLGLSDAPKPDDAADALAIAICHAHHFEGMGRIQAALEKDEQRRKSG